MVEINKIFKTPQYFLNVERIINSYHMMRKIMGNNYSVDQFYKDESQRIKDIDYSKYQEEVKKPLQDSIEKSKKKEQPVNDEEMDDLEENSQSWNTNQQQQQPSKAQQQLDKGGAQKNEKGSLTKPSK